MKNNNVIVSLLSLLVAGQINASDFSFGGQLTLSKASGDLKSRQSGSGLDIGFGGGFHGFIELGDGHALVPRVDFLRFDRQQHSGYPEVDLFLIGVDYSYFLRKTANIGPFLSCGLGMARSNYKIAGDSPLGNPSRTSTHPYWVIGTGFMFTPHLGVDVRYAYTKVETVKWAVWTKSTETAPTLSASFILRF